MRGASAALQMQGEQSPEDTYLTREAQSGHPGVRHWWGRRWHEGRHGAYCYLCDSLVATWDGRRPITAGARARVLLHRAEHLRLGPSPLAISSVEDR